MGEGGGAHHFTPQTKVFGYVAILGDARVYSISRNSVLTNSAMNHAAIKMRTKSFERFVSQIPAGNRIWGVCEWLVC